MRKGVSEPGRREALGRGWLVFLHILDFSCLSPHGEDRDAAGEKHMDFPLNFQSRTQGVYYLWSKSQPSRPAGTSCWL